MQVMLIFDRGILLVTISPYAARAQFSILPDTDTISVLTHR